jgi:pyrroloquinoline quinone (PQQ) biosynthesis protein C
MQAATDTTATEQEIAEQLILATGEYLQNPDRWARYRRSAALTRAAAALYYREYSVFAQSFPSWMAVIGAHCPYRPVKRFLFQNVYDEEVFDARAGMGHFDLLARLCAELGWSRADLDGYQGAPGTRVAMHAFTRLMTTYPWVESFAAITVIEATNSPTMTQRFGIPTAIESARQSMERLGISEEAQLFHRVHAEADAEHGGQGIELVAWCTVAEQAPAARVVAAAREGIALWRFYKDSIYDLAVQQGAIA